MKDSVITEMAYLLFKSEAQVRVGGKMLSAGQKARSAQ